MTGGVYEIRLSEHDRAVLLKALGAFARDGRAPVHEAAPALSREQRDALLPFLRMVESEGGDLKVRGITSKEWVQNFSALYRAFAGLV